jgi:hypothetical protein
LSSAGQSAISRPSERLPFWFVLGKQNERKKDLKQYITLIFGLHFIYHQLTRIA